jgi:hypothetical protein
VIVDKASRKVICTHFSHGKCHDFRLFKESGVRFQANTPVLTDSGYQGLQKLYPHCQVPQQKPRKQALTQEAKQSNKILSSERVLNENVIGRLKRFKIISDRYRNRRRRFGLRFNLIAGLYNYELQTALFKKSPILVATPKSSGAGLPYQVLKAATLCHAF